MVQVAIKTCLLVIWHGKRSNTCICVSISKDCRLEYTQKASLLYLLMSCATKTPLDPTIAPYPRQSSLTASLQESPACPSQMYMFFLYLKLVASLALLV